MTNDQKTKLRMQAARDQMKEHLKDYVSHLILGKNTEQRKTFIGAAREHTDHQRIISELLGDSIGPIMAAAGIVLIEEILEKIEQEEAENDSRK